MTLPDGKGASSSRTISARDAGLCADCIHARQITSDHASTFLQCQLSFTDPRFPKYPRLPVIKCNGYKPQTEAGLTAH